MKDYLIVRLFFATAAIAIYFAFKNRNDKTPDINNDDEPIDYILKN